MTCRAPQRRVRLNEPILPSQPSYLPPEAPLPTSGMAIASLVTGILGFTMAPILGGIIAILTGYAARKDTRAVPPRASAMDSRLPASSWVTSR